MKIVPAIEDKLRREVRSAVAKNPLITVVAMQEVLEQKFGRTFSFRYTSKLMNKVAGQARREVDAAKMQDRIVQLRHTHAVARERLMQILYWDEQSTIKKPAARDIAEAAKNLVLLYIAVMNAEVANGVYKTLQEASEQVRYPALPAERRQVIVGAFKKWGMQPEGAVTRIVETHARVIETSN
jgi:hypothetical protein